MKFNIIGSKKYEVTLIFENFNIPKAANPIQETGIT